MRYIADLHVHSKYSRACSANLTPSNLSAWARAKGIDVLATGDFTHPKWLKEIEEKMEPAEPGLLRLKPEFELEDGSGTYAAAPKPKNGRPVRFFLSTEVACIYKKGGRGRRLHLLIFMPDLGAVKKLVASLERLECNLRSDGRPILGLDAKEVVKLSLEADGRSLVVPAHAWTPWFSVFGSESGFDSLEECFDELAPQIHAIETGLSSDPPMNWRLSGLDQVMLISNSDAHGVRNLGREANAFELDELSYGAITDVLRRRQRDKFRYTIEFFPEEGKYHVDGHRACDFYCDPAETARRGGLCPKCGKELVRGVLGRVHALADRPAGGRPPDGAVGYRQIVPLEELLAETLGKGRTSKAVSQLYNKAIVSLGPEFDILLDVPTEAIAAAVSPRAAEAVKRMRAGQVAVRPGYDGVFGQVSIFNDRKPDQGRLDL